MTEEAITQADAIDIIRNIVKEEGSQTGAAKRLGIAVSYLSDILNGNRNVSEKIAKKLGYKKVIVYKKIEKGD